MFEISQKQKLTGSINLFGFFTFDLDLRYLGLQLLGLSKCFKSQIDVEFKDYKMEDL